MTAVTTTAQFLGYDICVEGKSDSVYTASATSARFTLGGYYGLTPEDARNKACYGVLKNYAAGHKGVAIIVCADISGLVFVNLRGKTIFTKKAPVRLLEVVSVTESLQLARGCSTVSLKSKSQNIILEKQEFCLGSKFYLYTERI